METAKADAATGKLQEFWKPGGIVNSENAARLKKWLGENSIDVPIPIFIEASLYAADRKRAVKELIS